MPRRRFSDFFIGRFAISSQTFSPFLLQTLKLGGCSGLTGLPESLGGLTGLQTLKLYFCSGIKELPAALGLSAGCSALLTFRTPISAYGACYPAHFLVPSGPLLKALQPIEIYPRTIP